MLRVQKALAANTVVFKYLLLAIHNTRVYYIIHNKSKTISNDNI